MAMILNQSEGGLAKGNWDTAFLSVIKWVVCQVSCVPFVAFSLWSICFVLLLVFMILFLLISSDICSYTQRYTLVLGSYKQKGWEVPVSWLTQRHWYSSAESTGMLSTQYLTLLFCLGSGDAWNGIRSLLCGVCALHFFFFFFFTFFLCLSLPLCCTAGEVVFLPTCYVRETKINHQEPRPTDTTSYEKKWFGSSLHSLPPSWLWTSRALNTSRLGLGVGAGRHLPSQDV